MKISADDFWSLVPNIFIISWAKKIVESINKIFINGSLKILSINIMKYRKNTEKRVFIYMLKVYIWKWN